MAEPVANTRVGKFEGEKVGASVAFKGIPYAAPPTGKRRFRPPEAAAPIRGSYDARQFRPSCLQPPSEIFPQSGPTDLSEDCLYLNVWTPNPDEKGRPVMVWIHGGAFSFGSGAFPWYDGTRLAVEHDVVVVTINYRLGPFGFLYLSALLGEGYRDSSNLGLQDQVAALRWVRDNIENFGGSPENVTVFGESAGAMSIGCLLGSPLGRGHFHKAIAQSGAAHNALPPERAALVAERFASEFATVIGSRTGSVSSLAHASAEAILEAGIRTLTRYAQAAVESDTAGRLSTSDPPSDQKTAEQEAGGFEALLPFQPVIDGTVLPRSPIEAVSKGSAEGVPLIVGTTEDEYLLFTIADRGFSGLTRERVEQRIERALQSAAASGPGPFGERCRFASPRTPGELYEAYVSILLERGRPAEPRDVWAAVATDFMFRVPAMRLAEAQSAHAPTYSYLFRWKSPMAQGRFGSCHALDIPFVFGTYEHPLAQMFCGTEERVAELSAEMRAYWTAFARDGRPQPGGMEAWPPYQQPARQKKEDPGGTSPKIAEFGSTTRFVPDPEFQKLKLWDAVL